jgi:hypothetical protein
MSQPRRRRRRRRRREHAGEQPAQSKQAQAPTERTQPTSRRRRRRGRGERPARTEAASSEELVRGRAIPRGALTAPPDGTTLEQVIGELQSSWGIPQNPQEFRITIKVAEEREIRGERTAAIEEVREDPPQKAPLVTDEDAARPRREKAPAAPRIGAAGAEGSASRATRAGRSRRSRRRRRRR